MHEETLLGSSAGQSPISVLHSIFYTSYPISYLFSCLGLGFSISLSFSNNKGCFTGFISGFVVWVSLIPAHLCCRLFSLVGLLAGFPL